MFLKALTVFGFFPQKRLRTVLYYRDGTCDAERFDVAALPIEASFDLGKKQCFFASLDIKDGYNSSNVVSVSYSSCRNGLIIGSSYIVRF